MRNPANPGPTQSHCLTLGVALAAAVPSAGRLHSSSSSGGETSLWGAFGKVGRRAHHSEGLWSD